MTVLHIIIGLFNSNPMIQQKSGVILRNYVTRRSQSDVILRNYVIRHPPSLPHK